MSDQARFDYIRGLIASVMLSAFETIQASCRTDSTVYELACGKRAYLWVMSDDREGAFSFLACCDVLELDPAHGRDYAMRIVHNQASVAEAWELAKELDKARPARRTPGDEFTLSMRPKELARYNEILKEMGAIKPQS